MRVPNTVFNVNHLTRIHCKSTHIYYWTKNWIRGFIWGNCQCRLAQWVCLDWRGTWDWSGQYSTGHLLRLIWSFGEVAYCQGIKKLSQINKRRAFSMPNLYLKMNQLPYVQNDSIARFQLSTRSSARSADRARSLCHTGVSSRHEISPLSWL